MGRLLCVVGDRCRLLLRLCDVWSWLCGVCGCSLWCVVVGGVSCLVLLYVMFAVDVCFKMFLVVWCFAMCGCQCCFVVSDTVLGLVLLRGVVVVCRSTLVCVSCSGCLFVVGV